jgi:hypothetical protein
LEGQNLQNTWDRCGKCGRNIPFGRPRRIWKDNIKINIKMGYKKYTGFICLKIGLSREHGNGPSDSIRVGVLLL